MGSPRILHAPRILQTCIPIMEKTLTSSATVVVAGTGANSYSDPVCAANLFTLQNVLDTPVSTDVIWENSTSRFLIPDIPPKTTPEELADELSCNNDIVINHMRRFVKPNSSQETSPVLVTILGTYLPDLLKSGS
ncbi:hypothetical protein AVEN_165215-1 [Araneus ventricosus]|uniref:Uncharacterized protein n=1 Tax=Araneus ventricosus TaxID=182803 RepID=A0A4Y2B8H0_ARAVE|nr:hypothetical protein AVEN_165215-1 [Araneus ventricosus]